MPLRRWRSTVDELRTIFTVGPQPDLSAQSLFTNRIGEVDAFGESVDALLRAASVSGGSAVNHPAEPRRNVLVYYGLGGIGKTALSKHLQRILASPDTELHLPDHRVGVRIDFGESGELDLEAIVLSLRCGFADLQPRWGAFDFVLARYWSRIHHGEPLPDYVRNHPRIGPLALQNGVLGQLDETARQVLGELGLAWAPARIAKVLVALSHEKLRDSLTYRRMSESCPFFDPLMRAEPDQEMLSYLPSLLSWELDRLSSRGPRLAVVFLDTFEPMASRGTRDFERLIQRVVHLMPYVLFVITSSQRLDWAELTMTTDLDYVGGARWPQLLASNQKEPRQHLVGVLSLEDCDIHLRKALCRRDGTPALSPEIRQVICKASEGLPLYLDLALTQFLEITAQGGTPRAADFGAPLPKVVASIMRHFDHESRDILRGVSLLNAFDAELASAASGARDAIVLRVLRTPVVVEASGLPWKHMLHPILRNAIRATDYELPDAWSAGEWQAAAQRLSVRLGELSTEAIALRWRASVASCLTQGIRLCAQFPMPAPWLVPAIEFLADCGMWSTFDVRMPEKEEVPASVAPFLAGLRGLLLRREGSLEDAVEQLDVALRSEELEVEARSFFELHRAHAVRNFGRYREARESYRRIVLDGSSYAIRARLQLADMEMLDGDFPAALETLDGLGEAGKKLEADVRGEAMRVRGHVLRGNCELEIAELVYRRARTLARMIDSPALEGKALTNLAETLCWTCPDQAGVFAGEAIDFNRGIGNQLEVLKAHAAAALGARGDSGENYEPHLDQARRLVKDCGYQAGEVFVLVAEAACLLARGEVDSAERSARLLYDLTRDLGVYRFWSNIVTWWLEEQAPRRRPSVTREDQRVRWLAPDAVRERWTSIL